jgi:O-antigen ligase
VFALLSTVALFASFPGGDTLLSSDGLRAQALFQDPNVYGPFLIPAALIVLEELINPRLLRLRAAFKGIVFVVLMLGILFSYSRAAWASTVLGVIALLVVLSMRRGGSRRAFLALIAITVVAMVTVTVISATGSLGFLQERATLQSYDSERFLAQRTGLELAFQKPVGIGPGQFETISIVATGNTNELATHSIYVRALAEQGLVGLLTLLVILLGTLFLAARNVIEGRDTYGIGSAALLAIWLGIMVNSAVVDTGHWRHLWLVAALIWAGATRPVGEPVEYERRLR